MTVQIYEKMSYICINEYLDMYLTCVTHIFKIKTVIFFLRAKCDKYDFLMRSIDHYKYTRKMHLVKDIC